MDTDKIKLMKDLAKKAEPLIIDQGVNMTVKELIGILKHADPDLEVMIEHFDYLEYEPQKLQGVEVEKSFVFLSIYEPKLALLSTVEN